MRSQMFFEDVGQNLGVARADPCPDNENFPQLPKKHVLVLKY
jgi:hypothetical protein